VEAKEAVLKRTGGADGSAPLVEIRDLSFSYPEEPEPVLRNVNLTIYPEEMIVLAGPSGCGKSTLCRHLNGIIPHLSAGIIQSGQVLIQGVDIASTPVHELASRVGMVHQNPDSQIVCLEVKEELAFGPENIGLNHDEIVDRVHQAIDWVQLHNVADSLTFECSGGQKQRVAIGSSLALLPNLLVMDEPTTDLDPVGARDVIATINTLRERLGLTFLIVEHDLDEIIELATRLIIMDSGRIVFDGPPAELLNDHYEQLQAIGLRIPQHIEISRRLATQQGKERGFSIRRRDAARAFASWIEKNPSLPASPQVDSNLDPNESMDSEAPAVELENVSFSYNPSQEVIKKVNLRIFKGEFVALVGANGSGKSTLARLIIGLLKPQEGDISVLGFNPKKDSVEQITQRAGYLFQNPDSQLFNTSVESEVAFGMRIKNMPQGETDQRVAETLALLELEKHRERHPFALSRGERQRLALATVLVTDPDFIILDEPTTGQDRRMLDNLLGLMRSWIERKRATVLMIAHDMDLVCQHARRTIVMAQGGIVADGPTAEVFHQNYDALQEMSLVPPPVVEISQSLVGSRLSRILLSIEDFDRLLSAANEHSQQSSGKSLEDPS
jgi:energy-coupling factor transport system ATP-binding protein